MQVSLGNNWFKALGKIAAWKSTVVFFPQLSTQTDGNELNFFII